MIVAIDLDGTISADPEFYRAEVRGLMDRGHEVHVLTGNPNAKEELTQLNFHQGKDYTVIVTVPRKHIGRFKVAYMQKAGVKHLIDNRKKTIKRVQKAGFTGHWHASPRAKDDS